MSKLEHIGTKYGGWTIPKNSLDKNSVCYCAGAGEDISFEVGLAEKYGCKVIIIDPTPQSHHHLIGLKSAIRKGWDYPINNSEKEFYKATSKTIKSLTLQPLGLWDSDHFKKKFYAPKKEGHVSHSIHNIQKTDTYFEAPVMKLSSIMKMFGHIKIDLLKMDIEGAEFPVIDNILAEKLYINTLCVEFHNKAGDVNKYVQKIKEGGFKLAHSDSDGNFTFVRG